MRWALIGLLLLGCKSGTRTTDTKSRSIKSKELKLAFLKDYMGSPTPPQDVEFHIVVHDNSGGMLAGPSDSDFQVAVKISKKLSDSLSNNHRNNPTNRGPMAAFKSVIALPPEISSTSRAPTESKL